MNEPEGAIPPSDARNFAMFCHLSSLVGYIGIPFGNVLGPLILWLIKKDQMPFVDDQGKEALNFNITVAIAGIICFLLVFVVIGIPLLVVLVLAHLVFTIIAAIKTSGGVAYRYPLTLRLIK
ncbi:MAG: DUF4870 domain-containing protein [Opitutales bacterium]